MAIKPILFNTEMVRAIQNGTKTVTRRVIKRQPDGVNEIKHPYQVGDILWVRETFGYSAYAAWDKITYYKADASEQTEKIVKAGSGWRPSIHMPREAARIFLRVTKVWPERIQEITTEEIIKEGLSREALDEVGEEFFRGMYSDLWDSTIPPAELQKYGFDANPYVRAITFERCEKPENWGV